MLASLFSRKLKVNRPGSHSRVTPSTDGPSTPTRSPGRPQRQLTRKFFPETEEGSATSHDLHVSQIARSRAVDELLTSMRVNTAGMRANLAVLQFPDAPSSLVWAASIGGAVVGGLGNGPLFVGQGLYFAHSTTRLAAARGAAAEPSDEQSDEVSPRAFLSGFFVTVYAEIAVELYAIVSRRA